MCYQIKSFILGYTAHRKRKQTETNTETHAEYNRTGKFAGQRPTSLMSKTVIFWC